MNKNELKKKTTNWIKQTHEFVSSLNVAYEIIGYKNECMNCVYTTVNSIYCNNSYLFVTACTKLTCTGFLNLSHVTVKRLHKNFFFCVSSLIFFSFSVFRLLFSTIHMNYDHSVAACELLFMTPVCMHFFFVVVVVVVHIHI